YYKAGLVKKVLLSNDRIGAAAQLGVVKSDAALNREVLVGLGVAERDIETFGSELASTREEVLALRDWAERARITSIIVPTEIFSARRLRWMLRRSFDGFDGQFTILVPALDPRDYHRGNWWESTEGIISFQNELLKYAFYRLHH